MTFHARLLGLILAVTVVSEVLQVSGRIDHDDIEDNLDSTTNTVIDTDTVLRQETIDEGDSVEEFPRFKPKILNQLLGTSTPKSSSTPPSSKHLESKTQKPLISLSGLQSSKKSGGQQMESKTQETLISPLGLQNSKKSGSQKLESKHQKPLISPLGLQNSGKSGGQLLESETQKPLLSLQGLHDSKTQVGQQSESKTQKLLISPLGLHNSKTTGGQQQESKHQKLLISPQGSQNSKTSGGQQLNTTTNQQQQNTKTSALWKTPMTSELPKSTNMGECELIMQKLVEIDDKERARYTALVNLARSTNVGYERSVFPKATEIKTLNDRLEDMKKSLMTIGESEEHRKHDQELIAAQIHHINDTLETVIKHQIAITSQIGGLIEHIRVLSKMSAMNRQQSNDLGVTIQKEFELLKKSISKQLKTSKRRAKKCKRVRNQRATSQGSLKTKKQKKWINHRIPDWREYYKERK